MIEQSPLPDAPRRVFQAALTLHGDPAEISRAVDLLQLTQVPAFAYRSMPSGVRIVLRLTGSTEHEARRAIQGLAMAIEHVHMAVPRPSTPLEAPVL